MKIDARYPRAHRQLGVVLRQKGDYEAAAAQLEQAVTENPEDAEARYTLGSVLVKLNDRERAIAQLAEAVRLDAYDAASRIALAGALRKVGRTQDAQEQMTRAQALDELKANAGRSRVLLGSAVDHLEKGEVDTALNELRQAVSLSPDYADAHFQLARASLRKGAPPVEVTKILRRVIELKPDDAQAHLELGLLLERMGAPEAAGELHRSLDLAPSLIEAHRALGKMALEARDWATARSEFSAILAWDLNDRDARRDLSIAQARQNHQSN